MVVNLIEASVMQYTFMQYSSNAILYSNISEIEVTS